jgi:hypothetical protein
MKWICKGLALVIAGTALAQTPAVSTAPTWTKVATEGASLATAPVVQLPAGTTYRWGVGTKWCDSVTITAPVAMTAWNWPWNHTGPSYTTPTCTVNGQPVSDVAPGFLKELDTQGSAPPPPPPPPPTRIIFSCIAPLLTVTIDGVPTPTPAPIILVVATASASIPGYTCSVYTPPGVTQ